MIALAALLLIMTNAVMAFVPLSTTEVSKTVMWAGLDDIPGSTAPFKNFDPLRLSLVGSDETLAWFRAAELKHSRVAMLASTGYLVQAAGIHLPGKLSSDTTFESLSGLNPFEQWEKVPDAGKSQIIALIFVTELATEASKPHYMRGGGFPQVVYPQFDFSGVDPDVLKVKQARELNNGRLAMIGVMSFIAEYKIPGSVPFLSSLISA